MGWPRPFKKGSASFDVTDIEKLAKELKEVSDIKCHVGVIKGGNKRPWLEKLAFWHEYGTGVVPARPFLRPTERYLRRHVMPEILGNILNMAFIRRHKTYIGPKRLRAFAKKELNKAGDEGLEFMRARILQHIPPPLKPATVKRKKALKFPFPTTPLIATGRLYQSLAKKLSKKE